jgi:hypothetical protein
LLDRDRSYWQLITTSKPATPEADSGDLDYYYTEKEGKLVGCFLPGLFFAPCFLFVFEGPLHYSRPEPRATAFLKNK